MSQTPQLTAPISELLKQQGYRSIFVHTEIRDKAIYNVFRFERALWDEEVIVKSRDRKAEFNPDAYRQFLINA